jgi:transcriptional regulator with XRE-family HTH domain
MNTALKMAILERGLTQIALAKAVGLSEPQLSRIIHEHQEATDDQKKAIAKVLHRKVQELFAEVAA